MKRVVALVMIVCMTTMTGLAQKSAQKTHKSTKRTHKPAGTNRTIVKPKAIEIDSSASTQIVQAAPSIDTTARKDTSIAQEIVHVVHDSVKAQIKAPIVQVPVTLKSLIVPGILFAYGAITQNSTGLRVINDEAREFFWDGNPHSRPYIEDYLLLVPAATVYGLNIAGVKGQNNLIDRSIIYGMSNAIANGFGFGLKYFGIETRPDGSDNYSFISGHTAEAFVSAEFLHQEYKGRVHWTVIAGGYAVATSVAYLRMYHNKHWLSDVVAGAGVGIASTRFSYYLYPLFKHLLFGSKKIKGDAMILPTYQNGAYGVGMVYKFH